MNGHRNSCDRCRQQKVRCMKNRALQPTIEANGNGDTNAPCERCVRADVVCIYSMRQKTRRRSDYGAQAPSPLQAVPFTQEMVMPMLGMASFDDNDPYGWNHHPEFTSLSTTLPGPGVSSTATTIGSNSTNGLGGDYDDGSEGNMAIDGQAIASPLDILAGQFMNLSNRATRATRQLQLNRAGAQIPLTVHSPVVNEAFEAADALIQIIPLTMSTPASSYGEDEVQPPPDPGLVFLVLAAHQHILTLFQAIGDSIEQSLDSLSKASEKSQPQALHGDGASSAQFVMVLQLVMHLINRVGRCLQLRSQSVSNSETNVSTTTLSHGPEPVSGGEECDKSQAQGLIDRARSILGTMPDQHTKLQQFIQSIQVRMEEMV